MSLKLFYLPQLLISRDIQAIQITNKYLEFVGLAQDSYAIVANIKIEKGDLAAIVDLKTNAVICGLYDEEFGIVCLENEISEPVLFDIAEIEIIGKIIGVGRIDNVNETSIVVKSLID